MPRFRCSTRLRPFLRNLAAESGGEAKAVYSPSIGPWKGRSCAAWAWNHGGAGRQIPRSSNGGQGDRGRATIERFEARIIRGGPLDGRCYLRLETTKFWSSGVCGETKS